MRTKHAFLALTLFSLLLPRAQAGLGETPQQLSERYGQPLSTGSDFVKDSTWCRYSTKGFSVQVYFLNGISQQEMYMKGSEEEFSVDELKQLFNATRLLGAWVNVADLDHLDSKKKNYAMGLISRRDSGREIALGNLLSSSQILFRTTDFAIAIRQQQLSSVHAP